VRGIFAAVLLAVVGATAWAAAPAAAGPHVAGWGFRAGWSGAQLLGNGGDIIAPQVRSDFTWGLFATTRLNSWLSFQPELAWVSKGGKEDFTAFSFPSPTEVTYTDFHSAHRLHYLEVPLLLRFELPSVGPLRPYTLAGPAPAWLLSEDDAEFTQGGSTTVPRSAARPARASAQIFEELGAVGDPLPAQTFDLGVVGGLGLWWGDGRVRLGLEGRYTQGLLDMVPGGDFAFHNSVFGVTAAIEVR